MDEQHAEQEVATAAGITNISYFNIWISHTL